MMYGYGWGNGGWGWGGIVMMVLMVVLVVAVIVAIIFAVRYLSGSGSLQRGGPGSEWTRAEDQLAERFARGEIDEEEFRKRMTLLREHR